MRNINQEACSTQHVLAVHDPNFPDMEEWLDSLQSKSGKGDDDTSGSRAEKTLNEDDTMSGVIEGEVESGMDVDMTDTTVDICPTIDTSPYPPVKPPADIPPNTDKKCTRSPKPSSEAPADIPSNTDKKRTRSSTPSSEAPPPAKRARMNANPITGNNKKPKSLSSTIAVTAKTVVSKASAAVKKAGGAVGISRSAIASRKLKADMDAGTHVFNDVRLQNFESKCRLVDKMAQFRYEGKDWRVFHSGCGKWQLMSEGYGAKQFEEHVHRCNSKGQSKLKFMTLGSFFTKSASVRSTPKDTQSAGRSNSPSVSVEPCSGITAHHDKRVTKTVLRTGADGGGARSITVISLEQFNKSYGDLSKRKKAKVDTQQMHEWTFRLDRQHVAIYSMSCKKSVATDGSKGPHACVSCLKMLKTDDRLKSTMCKAMPKDANFKHLNEKYRGKSDADRYAKTQGLQNLITDVHLFFPLGIPCILIFPGSECKEHCMCSLCSWCT